MDQRLGAPEKTDVVVHDYVDEEVPVLARMYNERARAYAALGVQAPRRAAALR